MERQMSRWSLRFLCVLTLLLGLSGIAGFVWMIRREIATTRAAGEAIQRQAEELTKSNAEFLMSMKG